MPFERYKMPIVPITLNDTAVLSRHGISRLSSMLARLSTDRIPLQIRIARQA